jgi:Tfp pilus assembly protein PilN
MTTIDFLPARYQERSVQRKTNVWRLAVLAIFTALVGFAAVGQVAVRRQAEAQLEAVGKQYDEVTAANGRLGELQMELRAARADAAMVTYLRHPWPRTQILALIAGALPEGVTLTKSIVHQPEATVLRLPTANAQGPEQAANAAAEAAKPAADRDLSRLREAFDSEPVIVTLEGTSRDEPSVHAYVCTLAQADLFSNVDLRSVERSRDEKMTGFGFNIRLVLRSGYGQPEGPEVSKSAELSRLP